MKNFKKTFAFIFFMLAGIILGAFIAYVCEGKDYVGWLAWGKNVGIESFAIDLYVIKFNIGLWSMQLSRRYSLLLRRL